MFLKFDEDKTDTVYSDWNCVINNSGLIENCKGVDVCVSNSVTDSISEITNRVRELEKKIETLMKKEKEQGIRAQLQTLQFK